MGNYWRVISGRSPGGAERPVPQGARGGGGGRPPGVLLRRMRPEAVQHGRESEAAMRRTASPRSGRRMIVACVAALGLVTSAGLTAASAAAGTSGSAAAGQAPLVVRTSDGQIRGLYQGVAREFLGVPYAASTAGALRWRPPRPHAPWRGIMRTARPGPTCAQTGSLATGVLTTSTAEDCLNLNVFTPRRERRRQRLPVMVWIPGGGFTGGA